ncbi:hypothetical protein KAT36_03625 [Candidatus Pacearchaeota archaeon]|nr:hypothetical protein [Candidatus Pacearchaeota archaeon]
MAWVVPMTAPVARFSRRMPVVDVVIIRSDVRLIASEMQRRMPIIILVFVLFLFAYNYGWEYV